MSNHPSTLVFASDQLAALNAAEATALPDGATSDRKPKAAPKPESFNDTAETATLGCAGEKMHNTSPFSHSEGTTAQPEPLGWASTVGVRRNPRVNAIASPTLAPSRVVEPFRGIRPNRTFAGLIE